jgi:hypothetical protein
MNKPKEIKFSDATLPLLDDVFALKQDFDLALSSFLRWQEEAAKIEISELEAIMLQKLQTLLYRGAAGWNEVELESKFIGPLFNLSEIEDRTLGYFMERPLEAEFEEVKLYGTVDGLIAKGTQAPKLPYFCMQEFKRSQDNKGRADGQALAAMLAAQALNHGNMPIYGLFVLGVGWNFMVLEGKEYLVSKTFAADGEAIFEIFKFLKALKIRILSATEEQ